MPQQALGAQHLISTVHSALSAVHDSGPAGSRLKKDVESPPGLLHCAGCLSHPPPRQGCSARLRSWRALQTQQLAAHLQDLHRGTVQASRGPETHYAMAACSMQYLFQCYRILWAVSMFAEGCQQQKAQGPIARQGGRVPNPDNIPASGARWSRCMAIFDTLA